jgi:hypothetical protein
MRMIRVLGALVAGAVVWEAIVILSTLAGRFVWPDYAAVETLRVFTLDMLFSRLMVGAIATVAFGAVVAWVARGDKGTFRTALALWLAYSVVDHYFVWDQFPIWYHLLYLAYIVPLAMLGRIFAGRYIGVPSKR